MIEDFFCSWRKKPLSLYVFYQNHGMIRVCDKSIDNKNLTFLLSMDCVGVIVFRNYCTTAVIVHRSPLFRDKLQSFLKVYRFWFQDVF